MSMCGVGSTFPVLSNHWSTILLMAFTTFSMQSQKHFLPFGLLVEQKSFSKSRVRHVVDGDSKPIRSVCRIRRRVFCFWQLFASSVDLDVRNCSFLCHHPVLPTFQSSRLVSLCGRPITDSVVLPSTSNRNLTHLTRSLTVVECTHHRPMIDWMNGLIWVPHSSPLFCSFLARTFCFLRHTFFWKAALLFLFFCPCFRPCYSFPKRFIGFYLLWPLTGVSRLPNCPSHSYCPD